MKFKVHWSFIVLGILMIIFGKFQAFLSCLICAILHEMGHSFVGRKLGYKLNIITLMPYGAMLSGKNMPFCEDDEIKIALAGPFVNIILIIFCFVIWWFFPSVYHITNQFMQANLYTLLFNLLPVYPLDGGRVLRAVLSKKINGAVASKVTKITGFIITGIVFILFFVSFIYNLNYMLGINALFMLIGLMEDDTNVYYQKLSSFEKFRFAVSNKCFKLNCNSTIFDAYKLMQNKKINKVEIENNNQKIFFNKNDIANKILSYPIDTKLIDLVNY